MSQSEIETMANEFISTYLFEHKETAKEGFIAGIKKAYLVIDNLEHAFDSCNQERKEYRDKLDAYNAEYSKLEKKYNDLLANSSLLI